MWDTIKEIAKQAVQKILEDYGLQGFIIIFLCGVCFYLIHRYLNLSDKSCRQIIKSKDDEIQRLVDERNKLQEYFLDKRISSKKGEKKDG